MKVEISGTEIRVPVNLKQSNRETQIRSFGRPYKKNKNQKKKDIQ